MSLRNRFLLPFVLLSVAVLVACGSSSLIHPLGGNFGNSSLKGQYVMKQTGFFANTAGNAQPFSETTVFSANGNGGLTVTVDDGGPQGPGEESLAGSYQINNDGTGTLIFNNPTATSNYAITMIDTNHFYVIEADTYALSSGYGVLQTSIATPSGPFVFKSHNFDAYSKVGVASISGTAFTGTQDILNLGGTNSSETISGSLSAPDSNGRGTVETSVGGSYYYYVVSPSEFYFMAIPTTGLLEIGQADAQTGGPFTLATLASGNSYVFGSGGDTIDNQPGIHSAGVFTTDGKGNVTGGSWDSVRDFNVPSGLPFTVSGTYTMDPSGDGNGTITLNVSNGSTVSQVFWMVNPTTAYFLVNSSTAIEDGTFTLQQGAPFSAITAQPAFFMDGVDGGGFKDRVGAFEPTSSGNFNWNQAANSEDNGPSTTGTHGSYTVTSSSNGRVSVVVNDVTSSVVFYLSSPNTGFMVQEDGADIGGAFTQQTSP